jgi:hypothetical protein
LQGVRSIHYAQEDPGLQWPKDPDIALDVGAPLDSVKIITPRVIKLNGGGYRMYYGIVTDGSGQHSLEEPFV